MSYDTWPVRILRLCAPLAIYLMIGLLSMAGTGGYSLAAGLLEKAVCASVMAYLFIRDSRTIYWEKKAISLPVWLLLIAAGIGAAVGINYLFFVTGLTGLFAAEYDTVTEALYGRDLLLEVLVMVIAAPLAEELLFRGLLFRRMRTYCSYLPAALITSLIFAAFHGNILQGAYGFAVGIALTYVYEQLHTIWAAVCVHAAANGISLLATETTALSGLLSAVPLISTAVGLLLLLVSCAAIGKWAAGGENEKKGRLPDK